MIKRTLARAIAGATLLGLTAVGCAAASGATPEQRTAVQAA